MVEVNSCIEKESQPNHQRNVEIFGNNIPKGKDKDKN